MFSINSWSLEDCFPRLFLVAEVWIWSLLPGSNPNAFISDLGSLELNLYLEEKKSNHSPVWRGAPSFPQDSVELFEPSVLQAFPSCSNLSLTNISPAACQCILLPDGKPLNFLEVSKEKGKSTQLNRFLTLFPYSGISSPMLWCSQGVPWWEKRWEGKWGCAGMGMGLQLGAPDYPFGGYLTQLKGAELL